ncbi:MAG: trypsin-like peptidase domain-containing protein [Pseudomonadota bacterium]
MPASAFPVAGQGAGEQHDNRTTSSHGEDSPRLAAGRFNKITKIGALWLALVIPAAPCPAAAQDAPFARETPVVRAVRLAGPAVVNISTTQVDTTRGNPFSLHGGEMFDKFFRDFFEPFQSQNTFTSLGSGVIIDGDKKLILTNEHVISRAAQIKVGRGDEEEYAAEVVGSDPDSDLAILRIKDAGNNLPALEMGDSSDLMIGETVIAIGNPFGLTHTVTTGVVSAVGRSVRAGNQVFRDFIQTDASINPGNSGGPLLNINGALIGINTAIYDGAEGIGFAIPIDKAKRIVTDLISYGEVIPVWLGLSLQDMDERLVQYFRLDSDGGVLITEVDPDGPAINSGLARGDVIIRMDSHRIGSIGDYEDFLRGYAAGAEVGLTVIRQGKKVEVQVATSGFPERKAREMAWNRFGLSVADKGRNRKAAVVDKVRSGSPAQNIGLAPGDFILRINEIEIAAAADFLKAITKYRFRGALSAIVQRGRNAYYINLTQ